MNRLVHALKRRPLVTSAFIVAVVFTCLFAIRSAMFMVYWSDPDHRDQQIQAWMTPRYVSLSWQVPSEVMFDAMQTDEMPGKRQTLGEIAERMGISFQELEQRILNATADFRAKQQ